MSLAESVARESRVEKVADSIAVSSAITDLANQPVRQRAFFSAGEAISAPQPESNMIKVRCAPNNSLDCNYIDGSMGR